MPAASMQPRNVVRAWLLLLLRGRSAHGYDVRRRLLEQGVQADGSTIYRALRDLEAHGLVTSDWTPALGTGPHKRVYKLTRRGRRELARTAQDMADARATFDTFLAMYADSARGRASSAAGDRAWAQAGHGGYTSAGTRDQSR